MKVGCKHTVHCRAWPSPCKLQPPEVTAGSWHHFLSSCDALDTACVPHEQQVPLSQQQLPPQKSARVGELYPCSPHANLQQRVLSGY